MDANIDETVRWSGRYLCPHGPVALRQLQQGMLLPKHLLSKGGSMQMRWLAREEKRAT